MVADSPYRKSTQTDADVDQLLSAASINVTKHCATGELPNVNMAVRKQFCYTAHKVMGPRLVPLQSSTTHSNFDTLQCILNLSCMRELLLRIHPQPPPYTLVPEYAFCAKGKQFRPVRLLLLGHPALSSLGLDYLIK